MTKNTSDIPSIPPGVTLTTLENGLTIIVRGGGESSGSCFQPSGC